MKQETPRDSMHILFDLLDRNGHVFVNHHHRNHPEHADLLKAPLSSVLLYHGPMDGCKGNFYIHRMSREKQVIVCKNCMLRHEIPNDAMIVSNLMGR